MSPSSLQARQAMRGLSVMVDKEQKERFILELKPNFSLCLGMVERSWSGNLEPPVSTYDKMRSGSDLGQGPAAKNAALPPPSHHHANNGGGGPNPFDTGVATPRLVRSSGMRRDWSFEDVRRSVKG